MAIVPPKQWGNNTGIILPSEALRDLGLKIGDVVEVEIKTRKRIDGFGILKGHNLPSFIREKDHRDDEW